MTFVEQHILALEAEAQRFKRAAQRITEIPGHIAELEDQRLLISGQIQDLQRELEEHQRTISMLPGNGPATPPTPAPTAEMSPEKEKGRPEKVLTRQQLDDRNLKMFATYCKNYSETERAKVDDIIARARARARGGKVRVDTREVKLALGEVPDARGFFPRNQLIPAMLKVMGCEPMW